MQNLDPVAPLQASINRWDRKAIHVDQDSPELVERKITGLLNKLTTENFDSISDQIIIWANKSEKEKEARTLIQVIRLVFEKATDEAPWSEIYARLCRKMMERISTKIQDEGIKNNAGRPIAGGQLFRKYLLGRCQDDFERVWVSKEVTAAAAAKAANAETEKAGVLYSDEYYTAQKARRQGLGLIKFIGELFKIQMLTERIMHELVKKLLVDVDNTIEERIEGLCTLLATVGSMLDTRKARAHVDVYFSRMKELTKNPNVTPQTQHMLQDILELRERKWIVAPTTIAQIQESIRMSRDGSHRSGYCRDFSQQAPYGRALTKMAIQVNQSSPWLVERKVTGLLNKLTMESFDSISDQIIIWVNKSEKEKDSRTLIQVIRLVFEKATDEAASSEMYARLCRKMMEKISTNVQDDCIKNNEGKPITGGQLFRKYLLNRCQEDFECGWVATEEAVAAAATKALEDETANAKTEEAGTEKTILYSGEYYAVQEAKRRGLGLIKFIGELFKMQMLTERVMHECVKKLLVNIDTPEEEEIEGLCTLLATVGSMLDTQKGRAHMDVYFSRMKEFMKNPNVNPRLQGMLQDILDLRERKWTAVVAPTATARIHQNAAKGKATQEKESYQRQINRSRGGSRGGGGRGDFSQQVDPDGCAVAGSGSGSPRPPPKVDDLSNFGKISKVQPLTFGPSSGKKGAENKYNATPKPSPQRESLKPRYISVERKIREDSKEFFSVRNLEEAEVYFSSLPSQYHRLLVKKMVSTAVESRLDDAKLASEFFALSVSKKLCSAASFEQGLSPVAEIIDDVVMDAPKAFQFLAMMVKAADLDQERLSNLASKTLDSDKFLTLLQS